MNLEVFVSAERNVRFCPYCGAKLYTTSDLYCEVCGAVVMRVISQDASTKKHTVREFVESAQGQDIIAAIDEIFLLEELVSE